MFSIFLDWWSAAIRLLTSARILPIELQRLFSHVGHSQKKNVSTGGLGWRIQKYLMEDGRGRTQL
jgi:hypothetical protein